jgi:AcrR family transcriptional regulator
LTFLELPGPPGAGWNVFHLAVKRVSMFAQRRSEAPADVEERARRIVETAVELAEQGGFEAVRLRDVASHAGVAMGTLYRRFRSKEDLLIAALELETRELERRVRQRPPKGADARERVAAFFGIATRGLIRRPNLARALLRAAACGEPGLAKQVAAFHDRMEGMVVAALRGKPDPSGDSELSAECEISLAHSLTLVWFALLVGWSGGLHGQATVIEEMSTNVELLLLGARSKQIV